MLRRLIRRTGFPLFFSAVFMVIMFVTFTAYYRFTESLSWLDAFYFTVITTRTIGFGDISPKTVAGKIGTIANAVLPATIFFGATLVLMQTALRRLESGWRNHVMQRYRDHDIIIADLDLLEAIIDEYEADARPFVVISGLPYTELPGHTRECLPDTAYLQGDPTRDADLLRAGIKRARNVVIAAPDDSENMYALVTARSLNPRIKSVVRVNHAEASGKFRSVGADVILPTGTLLGRMLSQAAISVLAYQFLLGLNTHTMDPFLQEQTVSPADVGRKVRECHPHAAAVHRRGSFIYNLHDLSLEPGDVIISIVESGRKNSA